MEAAGETDLRYNGNRVNVRGLDHCIGAFLFDGVMCYIMELHYGGN